MPEAISSQDHEILKAVFNPLAQTAVEGLQEGTTTKEWRSFTGYKLPYGDEFLLPPDLFDVAGESVKLPRSPSEITNLLDTYDRYQIMQLAPTASSQPLQNTYFIRSQTLRCEVLQRPHKPSGAAMPMHIVTRWAREYPH